MVGQNKCKLLFGLMFRSYSIVSKTLDKAMHKYSKNIQLRCFSKKTVLIHFQLAPKLYHGKERV